MASNSETTPASGGILGSPRGQRRLFWVSVGVLLAGIGAFVIVFLIHNNGTHNAPFSTRPVQKSHLEKTVKADPTAFAVAREFLQTDVARKNLAEGYTLVAPSLKGGLTKKQWLTGATPVVPYPAKNAKTAGLTIIHSWPKSLYVSLELLPKAGSSLKPAGFYLEVVKINGKWKVDYFEDSYRIPIPQGGP